MIINVCRKITKFENCHRSFLIRKNNWENKIRNKYNTIVTDNCNYLLFVIYIFIVTVLQMGIVFNFRLKVRFIRVTIGSASGCIVLQSQSWQSLFRGSEIVVLLRYNRSDEMHTIVAKMFISDIYQANHSICIVDVRRWFIECCSLSSAE